MNAAFSHNVDFATQQLFELLAKPHEVQQRSAGFHVDEEIDVALGAIFTASHGAEQTHVSSTMTGGDFENLGTGQLQIRTHALILRAGLVPSLPRRASWTVLVGDAALRSRCFLRQVALETVVGGENSFPDELANTLGNLQEMLAEREGVLSAPPGILRLSRDFAITGDGSTTWRFRPLSSVFVHSLLFSSAGDKMSHEMSPDPQSFSRLRYDCWTGL